MITSLSALTEMRQELYGQPVGAVSHAFGVEITKEADGVMLRAAALSGSGTEPVTVVVERKLADVTVENLITAIRQLLVEAVLGHYLKALPPLPQPAPITMPFPAPPWGNPIVPGNPNKFPKWPTSPPIHPMIPGSPVIPLNPDPIYIGDPPVPPFHIVCGDTVQGVGKFIGTATDETTGLTQMNDPNGDPT